MQVVAPWLATMLCISLAPAVRAADDADAPKVPISQQTRVQPKLAEQDIWKRWKLARDTRETGTKDRSSDSAPMRTTEGCGILAMDVRDQNGEYLGRIKDVVIDWQAKQPSHVVITTAHKGRLGLGGTQVVVPLTALAASPDQRHLILNAERSKVAIAEGSDLGK